MAVTVQLPTALRHLAEEHRELQVEGATVDDVLHRLTEQFDQLQPHLFETEGKLHHLIHVYLNHEDIRYLDRQCTRLQDGDVLTLIPSVSGGLEGEEERAAFTREEMSRYSRHLVLPEVGLSGQRALSRASVLCVGMGGLGSPVALYLAAAGVGRLGLVDFDVVDETNLQRQVIHGTSDVGRSKLDSARASLAEVNPHVQIDTYETRLSSDNALEILAPYDIVVDGTDNFPTRYLVNDACVLLDKPNVYGSVFRFEGQASVFWARKGPCYRCLFPQPPPPGMVPNCAEGGVLGILPGIVGLIQATEAVKLITGAGRPLLGRLLLYDALDMRFREMALRKDPECPVCGERPSVTELIDYEHFCGTAPEDTPVRLEPHQEVTPTALKRELDLGTKLVLLDVRERHEYDICRLEPSTLIPLGALPERARELNREADIVVYCRSGVRSAEAVKWLQAAGFERARNLAGGILRWADEVDKSIPKY